MKFTTLISVEGLAQNLSDPNWVIVDCRFSLDDVHQGKQAYQRAHIPGAIYADLEADLSGPIIAGHTGRHPLPEVETLAEKFGLWGIHADSQVIAYDDAGGMIAVRLWWLLRWLGHEQVAVLDGGLPAWEAGGQPISAEVPQLTERIFIPQPQPEMLTNTDDILLHFGDPNYLLFDSRGPDRFRGEFEPLDPVAGHIPGARNYFYQRNLDARGHFEVKDILRGRFTVLFGGVPAERVTFYCGSGVTAAHNALAMVHAGFGMPRIYPGSWSEWITDPERPIATGE